MSATAFKYQPDFPLMATWRDLYEDDDWYVWFEAFGRIADACNRRLLFHRIEFVPGTEFGGSIYVRPVNRQAGLWDDGVCRKAFGMGRLEALARLDREHDVITKWLRNDPALRLMGFEETVTMTVFEDGEVACEYVEKAA